MKSRTHSRSRQKHVVVAAFQLKFASHPKNIAEVEQFLDGIGQKLRLDDGTLYRLHIATTEAVNNAILHGNKSDPAKKVIVECRATKHCLSMRVRDEGAGFDSSHLPNPLDDKNLMKEHGRGVFLMRSMMDEVRFRRLKRGSIVHMRICFDR
jgi:serine/threonine-protein kinase RsbW